MKLEIGVVTAVNVSATHTFSKPTQAQIRLIAGFGVEGDAHAGTTVKHRSRVARDPTQPNLRQVHLVAAELHDDLTNVGLPVGAGEMGENITTRGIALLDLPRGARMRFGDNALIEVTGLRNPCAQLNGLHDGLHAEVVKRGAGIMAIVLESGDVRAGDAIAIELPSEPHARLKRV